ncbi:MAG: hypothetical protein ACFE89_04775 [Candidatus Hodarchaeota archaeon]
MNNRNRPPYVQSKRVKVHRARQLSDKLSSLPNDELRLLRKFINNPQAPGIQQILAKPVLAEYTIQELSVALAILSGMGEISLPAMSPPTGTVHIRDISYPPKAPSLPTVSLIDDQNSHIPHQINPQIAHTLSTLADEDFLHLAQYINNPRDPRSRFLLIRYHLYRFSREDLATTIATLLRLRRRKRFESSKSQPSRLSLTSPKFS